MSFCIQCGNQLDDGAKFCSKCGTAVAAPAAPVYAPVAEGGEAGFAYVLIEGKAVGKVRAVYGQTIEMTPQKDKTIFERLFGGK